MPVISFKLRGETMVGRSWKILNILFLLIFLLLSTCISLFHTENPLGYDPLCPACRFQHSTLATAQIDVVQLPTAVVLETVQTPHEIFYEAAVLPLFAARAPPLA
jgi:hypothetical protein